MTLLLVLATIHPVLDWNQVVTESKRQMAIGADLLAKQPQLGITAYIIAGDRLSAERADSLVAGGMKPAEALRFVGSYARFDWAVKNLQKRTLLKMLPELWSAADPDDTNPQYLALWHSAWLRNGRETVCDGASLSQFKLRIYRGQAEGATVGFAWTLDRSIAAKFAASGGLRGRIPNGVILSAVVKRKHVYGHITQRGESEIIIDPQNIWKTNERKTG